MKNSKRATSRWLALGFWALGLGSVPAAAVEPGSYWKLADAQWIEDSFSLARAILNGPELDPETLAFSDKLERSLGDFDLERLYKLMGAEEGDRHIRLTGSRAGAAYRVRLLQSETAEVGPATGDFAAELRLRPDLLEDVRGKGFEVGFEASFQMGTLSWQRLHSMLAGTLSLLQQSGTDRIELSQTTAIGSKTLGPEDRFILESLRADFPETLARIESVVSLDDLATPDPRGLRLTVDGHLLVSSLERDYPDLARWQDGLGDVIRYRVELATPKGGSVLVLSGETRSHSIHFETLSNEGILLPLDPNSTDTGIDLVAPGHHSLVLRSEVRFSFRGMRTKVGPWALPYDWSIEPSRSTIRVEVREPPPMQMEGNAYYVIPTALIDAFIPGSLDSISHDFAKVLGPTEAGPGWRVSTTHQGTARSGAEAGPTASSDGTAASGAIVSVDAAGRILDNGLVQLGMSMMTRKLRFHEKARADSRRLLRSILDALESDYRHFRAE